MVDGLIWNVWETQLVELEDKTDLYCNGEQTLAFTPSHPFYVVCTINKSSTSDLNIMWIND